MSGEEPLTLIPQPRSLALLGGCCRLPLRGRVVDATGLGLSGRPLDAIVEQLVAQLSACAGFGWRSGQEGPQALAAGLDASASAAADPREHDAKPRDWGGDPNGDQSGDQADILLSLDETLPSQGYCLQVPAATLPDPAGRGRRRSVTVTGGDWEGVRNGVQTLRQLVIRHGLALPCLHIDDEPVLKTRALSYDISRGRVPTLDTLKALADLLCLYKYNQLQLYTEHVVALEGTEQAWTGIDPLTPNDIRTLDSYCRQRGIELVPELATFGHLYTILRTQQHRGLGEHPEQADRDFSFVERMQHHTIDPTNPQSLQFVTDLVDRYAQLFSSRKFNICADETFDLGTGRSRLRSAGKSPDQLYTEFVGALCQHLVSQGRQPLMYADIVLKSSSSLGRLPAEVAFAQWDYRAEPSAVDTSLVASSGHPWYACPGLQTWNRLLPDLHAAWLNISRMCAQGQRCGAVGMIVTDWGDYGHVNDPLLSVPGIVYAAECSWCQVGAEASGRYERDLNERLSRLQYGDGSGRFVGLLAWAGEGRNGGFSWADMVQFKELDESGLANRDVLRATGEDVGDDWSAGQTGVAVADGLMGAGLVAENPVSAGVPAASGPGSRATAGAGTVAGMVTAGAVPGLGAVTAPAAGLGPGALPKPAARLTADMARQRFLGSRRGQIERSRATRTVLEVAADEIAQLAACAAPRPGLGGSGLAADPTFSTALLMLEGQMVLNDCGLWLMGSVWGLAGALAVSPGRQQGSAPALGFHGTRAGWVSDGVTGLVGSREASNSALALAAEVQSGAGRFGSGQLLGDRSADGRAGVTAVDAAGGTARLDVRQLRESIEEWAHLFAERWHQTSRESELGRLLEVFHWYTGLMTRLDRRAETTQ